MKKTALQMYEMMDLVVAQAGRTMFSNGLGAGPFRGGPGHLGMGSAEAKNETFND